VVVLEQHYVAGGCTHAFNDMGYEFDTGLHYVGRIEKYKMLIDFVSGPHKVEWKKLGNEADSFTYHQIKLNNEEAVPFQAGEENFVNRLVKEFPEEQTNIEKYLGFVKKVNKLAEMYFYGKLFHEWIQCAMNWTVNKEYFRWANRTTESVLLEVTSNARLRAILAGQWGDYGLTPEHSSFLIHAGIAAHYLDGAYYPVGGSQEISRAIIPTIEKAGAKVFVKLQ